MERQKQPDSAQNKGVSAPELLAPAGSFEVCRAAVFAGADAVYAGGSRFGARAYAQNFTEEELLEANCHFQKSLLSAASRIWKSNALCMVHFAIAIPGNACLAVCLEVGVATVGAAHSLAVCRIPYWTVRKSLSKTGIR